MKRKLEQTVLKLSERLRYVDSKRTTAETTLNLERQWRKNLQADVREKEARNEELLTMEVGRGAAAASCPPADEAPPRRNWQR